MAPAGFACFFVNGLIARRQWKYGEELLRTGIFAAAIFVSFFLGAAGAAAWHVIMVGDRCTPVQQRQSPETSRPVTTSDNQVDSGLQTGGVQEDESSYTGAFRGETIPQIMGDFGQSLTACAKGDERECQFEANAQLALEDRGVCLRKLGGWEQCKANKEKTRN